jgi:hypothetical protein
MSNGGKLIMLDGSKITGNTNTSTTNWQGAGVTVGGNGIFEMRGGEISGNTRTAANKAGAGGVLVDYGGTFTMSGGVIRGNTYTGDGKNYYAGGVYAGNYFEKTGGIIYGVDTGRAGYDAADDNKAGGNGATKANAVVWQDSSSVWHTIDGDLTGNFPIE